MITDRDKGCRDSGGIDYCCGDRERNVGGVGMGIK